MSFDSWSKLQVRADTRLVIHVILRGNVRALIVGQLDCGWSFRQPMLSWLSHDKTDKWIDTYDRSKKKNQ